MGFALRQGARPRSQACPLRFDFGENLHMPTLSFGSIPGLEAPLFLALAQDGPEVLRDAFTEPVDSGLGMFPGPCHSERHVYHPCVPLGQLEFYDSKGVLCVSIT